MDQLIKIIVNGIETYVTSPVSYNDLIKIGGYDRGQNPIVTYKMLGGNGIVSPGETVNLIREIVFDVTGE